MKTVFVAETEDGKLIEYCPVFKCWGVTARKSIEIDEVSGAIKDLVKLHEKQPIKTLTVFEDGKVKSHWPIQDFIRQSHNAVRMQ